MGKNPAQGIKNSAGTILCLTLKCDIFLWYLLCFFSFYNLFIQIKGRPCVRFPYYFPFHRLVVKKRPRVIYWRPDTSLICPPFIKPTTGVSIFYNRGLYFYNRGLYFLQQGSLFFTTGVSIFYNLSLSLQQGSLFFIHPLPTTQYNPSKQSATERTSYKTFKSLFKG